MALDLQLTGEGIAAIIIAAATIPLGAYQTYRAIRADRKQDQQIAAAAEEALQQRKALALVATNQETTHKALAAVVDNVAGVIDTVASVQTNVAKVELATNSMKDALRDTTALANLLQGRSEGIASEKQRAGAAPDGPIPDGAPSIAEVESAKAAQAKAIAKDAAMRVEEATTAKPATP